MNKTSTLRMLPSHNLMSFFKYFPGGTPMTASRRRLASFTVVIWLALSSNALAATLPVNFTEALFASGFSNPTAMAFAPDGRLFVCQHLG